MKLSEVNLENINTRGRGKRFLFLVVGWALKAETKRAYMPKIFNKIDMRCNVHVIIRIIYDYIIIIHNYICTYLKIYSIYTIVDTDIM